MSNKFCGLTPELRHPKNGVNVKIFRKILSFCYFNLVNLKLFLFVAPFLIFRKNLNNRKLPLLLSFLLLIFYIFFLIFPHFSLFYERKYIMLLCLYFWRRVCFLVKYLMLWFGKRLT